MEKYEKRIVTAAAVGTALLTAVFTIPQGVVDFKDDTYVAVKDYETASKGTSIVTKTQEVISTEEINKEAEPEVKEEVSEENQVQKKIYTKTQENQTRHQHHQQKVH